MSKDRANELARQAMAKAADEVDKLASSAEAEADLWMQVAQHLRAGNLVEAFRYKAQAQILKVERTTRHADRLVKFVEVCDDLYWGEAFGEIMKITLDTEVSKLTHEQALALYELHREIHGDDNCEAAKALVRRIKELER